RRSGPRAAGVPRRPSVLQLRARRQERLAHEVRVDPARRLAALPDRPHDERLAPSRVAAGEHARHGGLVVPARLQLPPLRQLAAELRDAGVGLGTEEAEREEHELARQIELAAGDLLHDRAAVVLAPLEPDGAEGTEAAVAVAHERLRVDREVADDTLLVRGR